MTTPSTCCVCGKETTQRCSSCAKAQIYIPFCSTEHQQLVWPTHKVVCGPGKCTPFTAPELTQLELFALGCIAHHPINTNVGYAAQQNRLGFEHLFGNSTFTVAKAIELECGLAPGSFDKNYAQLNTIIKAAGGPEVRQRLLASVRSYIALPLLFSGPQDLYFSLSDYAYGTNVRKSAQTWAVNPAPGLLDQLAHRATILNALIRMKTGRGAAVDSHSVSDQNILAAWEGMIRPVLPFMAFWLKDRADGFLGCALQPLYYFPQWQNIRAEVLMHPSNGTIADFHLAFA